jgi:hypothetical protein
LSIQQQENIVPGKVESLELGAIFLEVWVEEEMYGWEGADSEGFLRS